MTSVRTVIWFTIALVSLGLAQQADQKKKETPQESTKPKPLFDGKLNLTGSKTSKETAPMAFNGIDPSGKVDAKMMATTPTEEDKKKVEAMDTARPNAEQVAKFAAEGGLAKL